MFSHRQTKTCLLIFLIAASFPFAVNQVLADDWRTLTPAWKPTRIAVTDNYVLAAAEGGILQVNPWSEKVTLLNKDNGLFDNVVQVIEREPGRNIVWAGYANAGLDRIESTSGRIVQRIRDFYNEPDIFSIRDISFGENAVYLATDIGVTKMIPLAGEEKWIVQETYRTFQHWTGGAVSVETDSEYLYVGTTHGLARGRLDENLLQASNWQLFPFGTAFPDTLQSIENSINFIESIQGTLYASVDQVGVYKFQDGQFQLVAWTLVPYAMGEAENGEVLLGSWNGGYKISPSGQRWQRFETGDPLRIGIHGITGAFGAIWATIDTDPLRSETPGGIGRYQNGSWKIFSADSPGGNEFYTVKVSPEGQVWAAAGLFYEEEVRLRGVYYKENDHWEGISPLNLPPELFYYSILAIGFDHHSSAWIGTRGSGILRVNYQNGSYEVFNANDSTGARLGGISSQNDDFVLVGDFVSDPTGGLWLTNPENYEDKPLVFVPPAWFENPQVDWIQFGLGEGIDNKYISLIEQDPLGRLWLAPISPSGAIRPITMYDPHGTPEDITDDTHDYFIQQNVGFHTLRDMAISEDGVLWLAGPDSLYYIDTMPPDGIMRFNPVSLPLGREAFSVDVDPVGNVWVGTGYGVFAYDPKRQRWIHKYTPQEGQFPSPLVSENVNTLCIDPGTGELYIGTDSGLSILSTPYRNLRGTSDGGAQLTLKPNPFFVGDNDNRKLVFWGENERSVKIFTLSGRLVRSMNKNEASFGWDGRTETGDWAPTGVYLVVATDLRGVSATGKVAVIHR